MVYTIDSEAQEKERNVGGAVASVYAREEGFQSEFEAMGYLFLCLTLLFPGCVWSGQSLSVHIKNFSLPNTSTTTLKMPTCHI
jgi:hypothetical protein